MKKLNVIILTMILSLIIFAGVNVMAMDEDTVKTDEPKTVVSESALQVNEGGNTAEEVKAEEKEKATEEGNKEAGAPIEDKATETVDEKVNMGGVPSSNIDTDKASEPETEKPSEVKEEKKEEEKTSDEKAKEDQDNKSEEKADEKKDDNAEAKPEDAKKDTEAAVKTEEEKKQDETKEAEGKTDEGKAKEGTEKKADEKAEEGKEGENAEASAETKELEVGTVLDPDKLIPLGAGPEEKDNYFEVKSYDELVEAISKAKDNVETTIVVTESFEITKTITIGENKIIVLTSAADRSKVKPIGEDTITMPDENDDMARRQELVKEAEEKGEKALEDTDLEKNPLPNVDIILKRAEDFKSTLFKVEKGAKLTLGKDNNDPLFIDGNGDNVKTSLKASFIEVNGDLEMNGGFIANGNNEAGYSAPIFVKEGGNFTMNGGRITSNRNVAYTVKPDGSWEGDYFSAGGVYIQEGGKFTLNAGSIDNNEAPVGGVFVGEFYSPTAKKDFAEFIMNGGYIANNKVPVLDGYSFTENAAGGVNVNSHSKFYLYNGIIAGNAAYHGGGISIIDNYISFTNGTDKTVVVEKNYSDYIKYAGAYYEQNGGLIYKNTAKEISEETLKNLRAKGNYPKINQNYFGAGGGIYIDASTATLNGGYILSNSSENMGGGIYLSIAPHKLQLDHTLVAQNKAIKGAFYQHESGQGGGYWNCPVGNVDFEDFNSIYIFDNEAEDDGKDIATHKKEEHFILTDDHAYNEFLKFLTNISPVTEQGNIIKYLYKGKEVPEWMYHTLNEVYLEAIYDAKTKNEAWTNSNLFIMGNTALKGAGIGSNADIFSPGKPGNYEIAIEKHWDEAFRSKPDEIPESIWVDLFIGDAKYGEILLSKENGWRAKFENLPFTAAELKDKGIKYSIKERSDKFYSVVEEAVSTLKFERIWANYTQDGKTYDKVPHPYRDYSIKFIRKDKNGNVVFKDVLFLSNRDKQKRLWTAFAQSELIEKFTDLKDINITYYGFDNPYRDHFGLDPNSINMKDDEIFIIEKEDGSVEIQLPYFWTQALGNPDGRTDDYYKNTSGYRLSLIPSSNHKFKITNYLYSEIPVVKRWDESIEEKDIPDSVKVYLLRDGERVKDQDGNDRYVILSKENGWKGTFDKLPYFGIKGMGFEHYWLKENSEIFIPMIERKGSTILDIIIEREQDSKNYPIHKDYTGGISRIKYIPFEVHYIYNDGDKEVEKVYENKIIPYEKDHITTYLDTIIKDIIVNGNYKETDIEIKAYYDDNGNPFPRNLGKYGKGGLQGGTVINDGAYILKLVKKDGKLVIYVPKLTGNETEENLLNVKSKITGTTPQFEMTNYYQPKHRIEVEKIWETENTDSIPENLKIKIKGKYLDKEITLTPEEWKYFEEFLGKGILSANNYEFTEEDLEKFDGKQSIETTMEFEVEDENKNKDLSFKDEKGNSLTKEEFLKLIKDKKYSFELKKADKDKAEVELKYDESGNMVIVYPVDVVITEVAKVTFTNKEKPEEPPEPEEPPTPEEPEPKTITVRVNKVWEALGETRDIQVELYINGEASGKIITLSAANGWSASFTGLDAEDASGRRYTYSVREVGETGNITTIDDRKFEVSYSGDMYNGFTIVNKEVPPEEPEEPEEPHEHEEEPEEPEEERPKEPEKHHIPKTGVTEDVLGMFLGLIILLGLVYIKKKYIVEKSK